MLPYFKKYSIIACVIGIAPSILVTTVYPLFTGTIMAASVGGLLLLFVIFFASLTLGVNMMERKAEKDTTDMLSLYNDKCDPQALIDKGKTVAANITFPCKDTGAWFMSYYAQAMLDVGNKDDALNVERGLRSSMQAAKKPQAKVGILVNLIPLVDKTGGTEQAMQLIQEGLQISEGDPSPIAATRRAYLTSQDKIMKVRASGDALEAVKMDESIIGSTEYPMRIRVEAAWAQARAYFRLADAAGERTALDFVIKHGNKLALVSQAQQRLSALG
ncbi:MULTISPECIES: hypothetical protein [unclassified Adlercreutzia]|uniref:hypothetical protein n=1 Tax=unclassified Adlercreutzia TaxID=2636013 RepID=UPI0013ED31EB|nr:MULTISPECIES: hypothetical protein [unclassified Adlercreutzia]